MAKQPRTTERQGCGDHRRGARNRPRDRGGAACRTARAWRSATSTASSRAWPRRSSAPARSGCRSTSPAGRASRSFLDRVERELGPLTCLSTTPGSHPTGEFAHEPDAVTARVLDVNLGGTDARLQACARAHAAAGQWPHRQRRLGSGAYRRRPASRPTRASKHAIVGLTESLRRELAGTGLELHLMLAEPDRTPTWPPASRALRGVRIGRPEDVADAIVDALAVRPARGVRAAAARMAGRAAADHAPAGGQAAPRAPAERTACSRDVDALERAAYEARIQPPDAGAPARSGGHRGECRGERRRRRACGWQRPE